MRLRHFSRNKNAFRHDLGISKWGLHLPMSLALLLEYYNNNFIKVFNLQGIRNVEVRNLFGDPMSKMEEDKIKFKFDCWNDH